MKCYTTHIPSALPEPLPEVSEQIVVPAKMLGSAIADGRYNGVSDGAAGLLNGQYDNDSSMSVDPLCDLNTDIFGMRSGSTPPPVATPPAGED